MSAQGNLVWLSEYGRWAINDPAHDSPIWISSGDVVEFSLAGDIQRTRIEYDHIAKAFYRIDGFDLQDGTQVVLTGR